MFGAYLIGEVEEIGKHSNLWQNVYNAKVQIVVTVARSHGMVCDDDSMYAEEGCFFTFLGSAYKHLLRQYDL